MLINASLRSVGKGSQQGHAVDGVDQNVVVAQQGTARALLAEGSEAELGHSLNCETKIHWPNREDWPAIMEEFEFTEHARYQIQDRAIQLSWIEETLTAPQRLLPLADVYGNTHFLKQIPDFGNRWLRVVVNPNVTPQRVVTVFFDRRVK